MNDIVLSGFQNESTRDDQVVEQVRFGQTTIIVVVTERGVGGVFAGLIEREDIDVETQFTQVGGKQPGAHRTATGKIGEVIGRDDGDSGAFRI